MGIKILFTISSKSLTTRQKSLREWRERERETKRERDIETKRERERESTRGDHFQLPKTKTEN
jgi:hypothetical protein